MSISSVGGQSNALPRVAAQPKADQQVPPAEGAGQVEDERAQLEAEETVAVAQDSGTGPTTAASAKPTSKPALIGNAGARLDVYA